MNAVWTRPALRRLAEIRKYISENNPENARRFVRSLYQSTIAQLSMFPHSGRRVPELGNTPYREVIYKGYRVMYKVQEHDLAILTVRSGYQSFNNSDL